MYVKGSDGGAYRAAPQIPANYGGNAFTADEDQTAANQNIEAEPLKKESDLPTATDKGGFAADDLLLAGLILFFLTSAEKDSGKSAFMILILCRLLFGS